MLTQRDSNQIEQHEHDENHDAKRVVVVGGDFEIKIPEIKIPEIKFPENAFKEVEKPVILKEIQYKEIEKPIIVKEYEIKEIEKPVYIDKLVIKEIEKPIIIEKFKESNQSLPLFAKVVMLIQAFSLMGLFIVNLLKK